MSIFQKQKAHDLRAWLRIATMGLAAPAKERIRLEVEAHHAEAVAAHLHEGLSEPDAHSAALTELGDPDEAANCFRKQHLTAREAEQVEGAFRRLGSRLEPQQTLNHDGRQNDPTKPAQPRALLHL